MRPNNLKTFALLLIATGVTGCASYEIAPED
jgi:hypothetical protein